MKTKLLLLLTLLPLMATAQRGFRVRHNVPLDSIRLSDPAILADHATQMYLHDRHGRHDVA